jgi:hypothetical protein
MLKGLFANNFIRHMLFGICVNGPSLGTHEKILPPKYALAV